MSKNLQVFFSNRLEVLYQQLKNSLFNPSNTAPPFMRRLVVVYGPAMKRWLMLRMAQDSDLNLAFGIEFIYLNQAFENLLKLTSNENQGSFPTLLELSFAIEKELMGIVHSFQSLSADEQKDWEVLIHYLKIDPDHLALNPSLSRKMEKRLIGLSRHLARLFQDYGRYAYQMVSQWESPTTIGWQARLWRQLFGDTMRWTYPTRALQKGGVPSIPFTLHLFSISFMSACEFTFLNRLSRHISVHYYLLSPCAMFWSDIRSDRENAYLQTFLQKKLGSSPHKLLQLEEFLRDHHPLLANFGRLGREMAYQIEESQAQTHADYVLPQHVQALNEELFMNENLYLIDTETPLNILHALQADLLMMRNPQGESPYEFEEEPGSLQLHVAPSLRREVQILYHNLLGLMAKDPSLSPGEIIVMAPEIGDYVPYIQSLFGAEGSQLDFQILDLGMQTQSKIVQGFLQLIELSESRWEASELLQLFEHRSFQRRHQFSSSDYSIIQTWIEQAGIHWGDDKSHRDEVLERRHCKQGMVEETAIGTWDYGFTRLLLGLTTGGDGRFSSTLEAPPCSIVDFSQVELLEKWIGLLHSLRDDLSPLHDRTQMTIEDWVNYLNCLLENYFQPDSEDPKSIEDYEDLKGQFEDLRISSRFFKTTLFSFISIKIHLLSLLTQRGMTYREDHLHSVRFCSLVPLRSIPAKVIAILGLQEEAFPRASHQSSLNLMLGQENCDYSPLSIDYDRYLFLEAVHSAQDYLILSYQGYSRKERRELQPSLVVEELFSYLDKFYRIRGERISQSCIFKHPFDTFSQHYFAKETCLVNFSKQDFSLAKTHCMENKSPPHRFLDAFVRVEHPQSDLIENNAKIELKSLIAVARNPIKFHLNQILNIYLQTEEDRQVRVEEDVMISALNKYQLRHSALKEPLNNVLDRANREGKLPFGVFKTVATHRLREEVKEIHDRLQKQSVNLDPLFQIEFCTSCSQPTQLEEDRWLFPAATLIYEEGYRLSIVGKLSNLTTKGLIALSKGTLSDVWKVWPQFLLYCHAVKLCPEKLEPQLILAYCPQPKKAFFCDPDRYLKQFVNYYALCLRNFSPLLPDWISLILEEDERGLHDKMGQLFSEAFGVYQNLDLRWILNQNHLPDSEAMIRNWKPLAEELVGDIIRFWYDLKDERK